MIIPILAKRSSSRNKNKIHKQFVSLFPKVLTKRRRRRNRTAISKRFALHPYAIFFIGQIKTTVSFDILISIKAKCSNNLDNWEYIIF